MDICALDKKIEEYCMANQIMGTIRITVFDQILYQNSFGLADLENKTPFDDQTKFFFYSLSKPFCALGLLKLKDRGLVDLDAHPARYVAEAKDFDKHVTVRHLLLHASGLPDFQLNKEFCEKYAPGYPRRTREHVKLLTKFPSYFAAGTRGMYANINFVLCALIIENITGLNYADYMRKEIFEPLGMKTALIDDENVTTSHLAQGYALENGQLIAVEPARDWLLGAGDIVGTVDDVYCLNKAIKHGLLLTKDTWLEVLTASPVSHFGMGCRVSEWRGKHRVVHNGGHTGFRTLHEQILEDDFDLIILSNTGFGNARDDLMMIIHNFFYGTENQTNEKIEMDKGYI